MKCLRIAKEEFIAFICNPRMLLIPCMVVVLYSFGLVDLLQYSIQENQPINIVEPFVGVCNSPMFLGLIPIVFFVLLSDFPRTDNNIIYKIFRIGRKRWVLSELLFLFFADLSFMIVTFLGICISCGSRSFIYNGWSDVILEFLDKNPELSGSFLAKLIPPNIYYHMLPYKAACFSALFLFFYLFILGLILLVFKLLGKQVLGIVVTGSVILIGAATCGMDFFVKWLFPAAHSSIIAHYSNYYSHMNCKMEISFIYFLGLILVLGISSYILSAKYDYMKITKI